MKTKKVNREEVRTFSLTIPMTKKEKERIEKSAGKKGLSMSALGRIVFCKYLDDEEREEKTWQNQF